jgi:protein TonB
VIPLIEPGDKLTGTVQARRSRQRASRVLAAFLGASVAVHAAVLVILPPLARGPETPGARTLEVMVLQLEQLPIAPLEAAPQPPLTRAPGPGRVPAKAPPKAQPEQRAPILALTAPQPANNALTAPPARPPEPLPAAPEQKARTASAATRSPASNAAYLRNLAPHYPVAARRAGEQGTVTLRVLVSLDGLASRVAVEKSSGSPHLDAAALEAVKAWRFTPARRGVDAVESWMLVPIVFRLEGTS